MASMRARPFLPRPSKQEHHAARRAYPMGDDAAEKNAQPSRRALAALAAIGLVLLPPPAAGHIEPASAGGPPQPAPCRAAIEAAESAHHIPDGFLSAIARVESGRPDAGTGLLVPWPWTINAEGTGSLYASKAEAIAAVHALQARGVRSIDVGCLQVNLLQHPDAFASLDQAFDPAANAGFAAGFLAALFGGTHSWPLAAAAYHSQTASLGSAYQRRVLAQWAVPDLGGTAGSPRNTARRPTPSPTQSGPGEVVSVLPAPAASSPLPGRPSFPVRAHTSPFAAATGRSLAAYRGMPTQLARALPRKAG